jgi:hypothetical protein
MRTGTSGPGRGRHQALRQVKRQFLDMLAETAAEGTEQGFLLF